MESLVPEDSAWSGTEIECIDMHTTGQPTRIVVRGFPELTGSLFEQREQAKVQYDHIRRRLLFEPRGHTSMFGVLLRPKTELTESGEAHIGVLFMQNGGFSDICGHSVIAVSRMLVDTHEDDCFPLRKMLTYDSARKSVQLKIHTTDGVIIATVPTTHNGGRSDPSRDLEFVSTPAFATGIGLKIEVPPMFRWNEKMNRLPIHMDVGYGGAWFGMVSAYEMGFWEGLQLENVDAFKAANLKLKDSMTGLPGWKEGLMFPQHSSIPEIKYIMIVDEKLGLPVGNSTGAETGMMFYGDNQIDRSPTGGCVVARVAVAYQKGLRELGESHTYHSMVSNALGGQGYLIGTPVEEVDIPGGHGICAKGVKVKVTGKTFYTGRSTYLVEEGDPLGDGFSLDSFLKKFR